jgi:hypothetical protein
MSYCPNCEFPVKPAAAGCANCGAVFDGAAWRPVESLPGKRKQKQTYVDPRSPIEKTLDLIALIGLVLGPISCMFVGFLPAHAGVAYGLVGVPLMIAGGIFAAVCRLLLFLVKFVRRRGTNAAQNTRDA